MGVLCDFQIRSRNFITPFSEMEKREGKISWGCGSYGYDVRADYVGKIFSPIGATVIDPKNFDPKALVTVDLTPPEHHVFQLQEQPPGSKDTHYCIHCNAGADDPKKLYRQYCPARGSNQPKPDHFLLPPHSFMLVGSMEEFDIPRDVHCLVMGKCLTGDTRIFNPETGEYRPLVEGPKNVAAVAFSSTEWEFAHSSKCSKLIRNGVRKVWKIVTHSGAVVKATANHPFMKYGHDGGWTELHKLKVGDEIARANHLPFFGKTPISKSEVRLMALMIADGQCRTPGYSPTYTKHDPRLVRMLKKVVPEVTGCVVTSNKEHRYGLVNREGKGGVATKNRATAWLKKHGLDKKSRDKFVPEAIFKATKNRVAEFLRVLFTGDGTVYVMSKAKYPGVRLEYSTASERLIKDVQHLLTRFGVNGQIRHRPYKGKSYYQLNILRKEDASIFFKEIGFVPGSFKDTFYKESGSRYLTDSPLEPNPTAPDKIVSIEEAGEEEVFDIEVPEYHNFEANGLIVHNSTYARCGIIVNVTPGEPEWKGKWTIEISNTTPLPVKIYPGEGIMQCVFFRSDGVTEQICHWLERVMETISKLSWVQGFKNSLTERLFGTCETSYKDRKGKYQNQEGLTLPKVEGK